MGSCANEGVAAVESSSLLRIYKLPGGKEGGSRMTIESHHLKLFVFFFFCWVTMPDDADEWIPFLFLAREMKKKKNEIKIKLK